MTWVTLYGVRSKHSYTIRWFPWALGHSPPRPLFLLLPASKIHIDTFLASSVAKINPSEGLNPMTTLE